MLLGWSTRSTADKAVFTKRGEPSASGMPSLKTPIAAHAYIRRSTISRSLFTDCAMAAAVMGPSLRRSGILNLCARLTRTVWWYAVDMSRMRMGGGVSASAALRSEPARTLTAMKIGHGGGDDQSERRAAS